MQTELSVQHNNMSSVVRDTEYIIYVYNRFHQEKLGCNRWQRVTTVHNLSEVLSKAEALFQSNKYQKIEIKKKVFHNKKGRYVASTFRVFENRPKNNYFILATALLLAASFFGLFYLGYF